MCRFYHNLYLYLFCQTDSLGHPYGNCSTKELKYYKGPYSKLKCIRECEMVETVARCECKKPYMEG